MFARELLQRSRHLDWAQVGVSECDDDRQGFGGGQREVEQVLGQFREQRDRRRVGSAFVENIGQRCLYGRARLHGKERRRGGIERGGSTEVKPLPVRGTPCDRFVFLPFGFDTFGDERDVEPARVREHGEQGCESVAGEIVVEQRSVEFDHFGRE